MHIQHDIALAEYSTMRIGCTAAHLVEITNEDDLVEALSWAFERNLKVHVIGSGSNTIFGTDFNGLVIVNKITGINMSEDENGLLVEAGAGENWDTLVAQTVERGFIDIAALSLIPGTVGAAPIQNIGAYGQQVSDVIESVRVCELESRKFVTLTKGECAFTYRASRFNSSDRGKYVIASIKLRLSRKNVEPSFYADVHQYFVEHGYDESRITPAQLREAVSKVRVVKLPDPSTVANCGSFFKNPVVSPEEFDQLSKEFPELKAHKTDDGNLKLYGGQLIDMCGLKGFHDAKTGMATWDNHALVLVNESAKSITDLLEFKQMIVEAVQQKFGITLIQEPELVES